jgi:hypothetical protein
VKSTARFNGLTGEIVLRSEYDKRGQRIVSEVGNPIRVIVQVGYRRRNRYGERLPT